MAVGTLAPVAEYLQTSYDPDCEYIDGEIRERNVGELSHGRLQMRVAAWFYAREAQWGIKTVAGVRLQITPQRFRVPDVILLSAAAPVEEVVVAPPLLCIEILSPRDTLNQIWTRAQDYLSLGTPSCWILDPVARRCWTVSHDGLAAPPDGILRAGDIAMPAEAVLEAEESARG